MPIGSNILAGASAQSSGDLGEDIPQSLRFNTSGFLIRAQSSSGDGLVASNRTWTFSTWFKHGDMGETNIFGFHSTSQNNWILSWTNGASYDTFLSRDHTGWQHFDSTQKFRDTNAWYHIFITCSSGVMTMKVNNVARGGTVTQNHSMDRDFVLGAEHTNGGSPMDGYLAETYFFQGSVLDPVNNHFIRQNKDGIWVPDTPTNTDGSAFSASDYGTNGWHLTYDPTGKAGQTGNGAGIGADHSPNNNHFTPSGFDTSAISSSNPLSDVNYLDTPTRNFSTWNPLHKGGTVNNATAQGNLHTAVTGSEHGVTLGKKIPGKDLYFELDNGYGSSTFNWGNWWNAILLHNGPKTTAFGSVGSSAVGVGFVFDLAANIYANNISETQLISSSSNSNTIYGVKITDTQLTLTKDGSATNVTNLNFANNFDKGIYIYGKTAATTANETQRINFGQQAFLHEPANVTKLEANEIDQPTIKNGKKHFGILLYNGNGSTKTVTDADAVDFKPDFVWIKARTGTRNHFAFDCIRGGTKGLLVNDTNSDVTRSTFLSSFDNNGFSVGADGDINANTVPTVAWCWKAGGEPTATNSAGAGNTPTAGSVKIDGANKTDALAGANPATKISANTKAGFSIVEYNGTGSQTTVAHGLTQKPEFIVLHNTENNAFKAVYHKDSYTNASNPGVLYLNVADAANNGDTNIFGTSAMTLNNTVFTVGTYEGSNASAGDKHIAYCWHSVDGFSQIGSYQGNNSTDGIFVYTGFKVGWLLIKRKGTADHWTIYDTTREPFNPNLKQIYPNLSNEESTSTNTAANAVDLLSNGFKMRNSDSRLNATEQYVYVAFAEHPFGGENVPPATAR